MLSISTKVERIVTESPFLSEGLRRGLINLSELARQLQPQLQNDLWKPVGQAAVVMALRRVAGRLPDRDAQELVLAQQSGQLTARTDLVEFTFRRSKVDLPQPEGPMKAVTLFSGISRLMPLRAWNLP